MSNGAWEGVLGKIVKNGKNDGGCHEEWQGCWEFTLCTFALEEDKFELLPKQKDKY
jgi:hypothetical protein